MSSPNPTTGPRGNASGLRASVAWLILSAFLGSILGAVARPAPVTFETLEAERGGQSAPDRVAPDALEIFEFLAEGGEGSDGDEDPLASQGRAVALAGLDLHRQLSAAGADDALGRSHNHVRGARAPPARA